MLHMYISEGSHNQKTDLLLVNMYLVQPWQDEASDFKNALELGIFWYIDNIAVESVTIITNKSSFSKS